MSDFLCAFRADIKAKGIFLGRRVAHECATFGCQAKVSVKKSSNSAQLRQHLLTRSPEKCQDAFFRID